MIWTMKGIVWKFSCVWWSICLSVTKVRISLKVNIFSFMHLCVSSTNPNLDP